MDIGKMRHPVTIRALQMVQDPQTGEMVEGWEDLATVWASIEGIWGREYMAASAERALTSHRITMHHRDDLTADMRLYSAPTEYQVKAILPNNDRSFLTVMCEVLE